MTTHVFDGVRDFVPLLHQFSICSVAAGLYPGANQQATSSSPQNQRSESCIAINPKNPANLVGVSKKFIDPATYRFRLGVIYSFDSGETWAESQLPLKPGWDVMTDPTVTFDGSGNAFLVGEPDHFNTGTTGAGDLTGLGMVVYRSQDGGVTWQEPIQLTSDTSDDKQWVVCDNQPGSPHRGNVYVAWGASSPLRFARSTDGGQSWKGRGSDAPGSALVSFSFSPELTVAPDGTLHILWHNDGSGEIQHIRSLDGGETFEAATTVVSGIKSLRGNLPITDDWPHFEFGKFRVITLVTDCVTTQGVLVVAWADMREGYSRIYYRRSLNNGVTWEGDASGQPLLPNISYGSSHCFHPQIACTRTGVVGCAFYVFGEEFGKHLIKVQLAGSWNNASDFSWFVDVTDRSWDPAVDAPAVHGDPNVTFIGEYFGLAAGVEDFAVLWTDTRTGVQELFFNLVQTKEIVCPRLPDLVAQILAGVVEDGGGLIIVGGKIIRIPPRSPVIQVLEALATLDTVAGVNAEQARQWTQIALQTSAEVLARKISQSHSGLAGATGQSNELE